MESQEKPFRCKKVNRGFLSFCGDQTKFLSPFLQWQGVGHGKVISSAVRLLGADVEADV